MPARILSGFAVLLCCQTLCAGEADPLVTARENLAGIIAARDRVVAQINQKAAEDAKALPPIDVELEAQHLSRHRAMVVTLYRRGTTWYGGPARGVFNSAIHHADASGLVQTGDQIRGTLKITLNPDQWIPADHLPRFTSLDIEARIADGKISGTYVVTGELGPDKDAITGVVSPVMGQIAIAGPTGKEDLGSGDAGLIKAHELATQAYRQLRAAGLVLAAYPKSFEAALAANRVPPARYDLARPEHAHPSKVEALAKEHAANAPRFPAEISAHLARLHRIGAAFDPAKAAAKNHAIGFCGSGDPQFGPYFGFSPLAKDAAGNWTLPAETGSAGPQRWQIVNEWSVTGPFPAPLRSDDLVPGLPEWVPLDFARYETNSKDFPEHLYLHPDWIEGINDYLDHKPFPIKTYVVPPTAVVRTVPAQVGSGRWQDLLIPDRWAAYNTRVPIYGVKRSFWFAHALLNSPREMDVWAEAKPRDAGQLWVNDRLAWVSELDLDGVTLPKVSVFRIHLKAGVNELVFRCRDDGINGSGTGFRLSFCTRGVPADAATVAARAAAASDGGGVTYNFRGNGTGSFPAPSQGRPPLAWDVDKGVNVRWRTELPAFTHGYPVVFGDRIYVNSEPHVLYCLDKLTGAVIWKRASSLADLWPENERGPAEAAFDQLANIYGTKEADPEVEKWRSERKTIEERLRDECDKLKEDQKKKLQDEADALSAKIDERTGAKLPGWSILRKRQVGGKTSNDYTGYAMATPAIDAKNIVVRYATGAVACYDHDGNRKWLVDTLLNNALACAHSPVVIGDRVVVGGNIEKRLKLKPTPLLIETSKQPLNPEESYHCVVALDLATGKEVWEGTAKASIGYSGAPGSLRALRLKGPDGPFDVVLSWHSAWRASDGLLLNSGTGTPPGYQAWTSGNRVWTGGIVAEFWGESPDQLGLRFLRKGGGGGVLAHDGFLYGSAKTHLVGGKTSPPWVGAMKYDPVDGSKLWEQMPIIETGAMDYVPPSLCGDYLYVTQGYCDGNPYNPKKAEVAVVRIGQLPMVIGRSFFDAPTFSGPVFDQDRMYVRTKRSLTCFQTTTDEGRQLEYDVSVKELFDSCVQLPTIVPQEDLPTLPPVAGFVPPEGVPVAKAYESVGPPAWLVAGPFTGGTAAEHFAALGGPAAAQLVPGTKVGEATCQALDAKLVASSSGLSKDLYNRDVWNSRSAIDLTTLSGNKGSQIWYFYSVIEGTRPQALRYSNPMAGCTAWLAGKELKHDQIIRLGIGYYPLLVRVPVPKLPPFATGRKMTVSPNFVEVKDPSEELEKWRAQIRPFRARLEEAVQRCAGTKASFQAKQYLEKLGR